MGWNGMREEMGEGMEWDGRVGVGMEWDGMGESALRNGVGWNGMG